MKKIFAIIVITLMVSVCAYAAQDTAELGTQIAVAGNFDLDIGTPFLDFGNVQPGSISTSRVCSMESVSNTGNDWSIQISNTPMSDGTNVIPNESCKVFLMVDEEATGTSNYDYDNPIKENLPGATPDIFYDSGSAETGQLFQSLMLYVTVPGEQPAGSYSNAITLTMIED